MGAIGKVAKLKDRINNGWLRPCKLNSKEDRVLLGMAITVKFEK
jgi:hypothetical protein